MISTPVIKSYIWHKEQCYFVSTIERDSSSPYGPRRYNETMVWEYNWETSERGKIVYQGEDGINNIATHLYVVKKIYQDGVKSLDSD